MVEHLKNRPPHPLGVEGEDPQSHEAHVGKAGVGHQPFVVGLGDGHEGAVKDRDDGEPEHHGSQGDAGVREEGETEPQQAVDPHLGKDRRQQDRHRGGSLGVGLRQPGVEREDRRLHREGQKEGQEGPELEPGREIPLHEDHQVEGFPPREIEGDDPHQHQDRSRQGIDEELQRGLDPPRSSPDPDQEIHGDQHRLPEDVEEDQVEGEEDPQDGALQNQDGDQELPDPLLDLSPGRHHRDGGQEGRQEDHQEADPVHAEGVLDVEGRHPGVALHELHLIGGGIEVGQNQEREDEIPRHDGHGRLPDEAVVPPHEEGDQRTDQGEKDHQGQEGKTERIVDDFLHYRPQVPSPLVGEG